jgi:hypothetical protein
VIRHGREDGTPEARTWRRILEPILSIGSYPGEPEIRRGGASYELMKDAYECEPRGYIRSRGRAP